ncbi:MAG: hypothetical protein KC457_31885, partial [Myxococcales bacterium]|nr:hypothetical protein [Myxococcales bacterium]
PALRIASGQLFIPEDTWLEISSVIAEHDPHEKPENLPARLRLLLRAPDALDRQALERLRDHAGLGPDASATEIADSIGRMLRQQAAEIADLKRLKVSL